MIDTRHLTISPRLYPGTIIRSHPVAWMGAVHLHFISAGGRRVIYIFLAFAGRWSRRSKRRRDEEGRRIGGERQRNTRNRGEGFAMGQVWWEEVRCNATFRFNGAQRVDNGQRAIARFINVSRRRIMSHLFADRGSRL